MYVLLMCNVSMISTNFFCILFIASYPVSEAISSSLLWMGNQVLGLIILLVLNTLRNPDGTYTRGLIFAACIVCPLSILSTIYNSPNKRSEFEKRNKDILYNDE